MSAVFWRRLEARLILLISLHSLAVAAALLIFPVWGARFGGWEQVDPDFFPRQAGVFHVVVAAGYLIEYVRYRGVLLLLTTKAIATLFLFAVTLAEGGPWSVPVSGLADGLMGLAVYWVHGRAGWKRRQR